MSFLFSRLDIPKQVSKAYFHLSCGAVPTAGGALTRFAQAAVTNDLSALVIPTLSSPALAFVSPSIVAAQFALHSTTDLSALAVTHALASSPFARSDFRVLDVRGPSQLFDAIDSGTQHCLTPDLLALILGYNSTPHLGFVVPGFTPPAAVSTELFHPLDQPPLTAATVATPTDKQIFRTLLESALRDVLESGQPRLTDHSYAILSAIMLRGLLASSSLDSPTLRRLCADRRRIMRTARSVIATMHANATSPDQAQKLLNRLAIPVEMWSEKTRSRRDAKDRAQRLLQKPQHPQETQTRTLKPVQSRAHKRKRRAKKLEARNHSKKRKT